MVAAANASPTIGNITLGLDNSPPVITWNVTDSAGIQTSSITIDGAKVSAVYGPYGPANNASYAAAVGTLSTGSHTYVITATDVTGVAATPVTASFTVGTPTSGPTIGSVTLGLDSSPPVITWNVTDSVGIQTSSITIDGGKVSTVYGPYGSGNNVTYAAAVGTLSAGSHTYVIAANDVNGATGDPGHRNLYRGNAGQRSHDRQRHPWSG